jgi:release factor glutamine methyltransferase
MLPTPSTSHVAFERVYEPAEDSFLFLDTLSSTDEKQFLRKRFTTTAGTKISVNDSTSPLVVEIGTGSGVVLSFLHAHAEQILGRPDVFTVGVDVNCFACNATQQTVQVAEKQQLTQGISHGFYLGNIVGDLTGPLKYGEVDVLIFNPPYVPTLEVPALPTEGTNSNRSYEDDSHLLSLSYAGGADGMETTDRLLGELPGILNSDRGCAYILLCARNKPDRVKDRVKNWGNGWMAETVANSGKRGGWEKLQIIRIWREPLSLIPQKRDTM